MFGWAVIFVNGPVYRYGEAGGCIYDASPDFTDLEVSVRVSVRNERTYVDTLLREEKRVIKREKRESLCSRDKSKGNNEEYLVKTNVLNLRRIPLIHFNKKSYKLQTNSHQIASQ